jgi:uncharacterized protein (TIGR00730 family)
MIQQFNFKNRIQMNRQYFENIDGTAELVQEEIRNGLEFIDRYEEPLVSVLGGAQVKKSSRHYKLAYKTGYLLGEEGYAVATGGGIGIMEAANQGAKDGGGISLGIKAELIHGEAVQPGVHTDEISLHFVFVRRFLLAVKSQALIFFPGGYGTLSEFFEFLVLMKLNIGDDVPLIFVDKEYWKGLFDWMHNNPAKEGLLKFDPQDIELLQFAEKPEEIVRIVKGLK